MNATATTFQPRIARMWLNGPCRYYSEQEFSSGSKLYGKVQGYVGSYVCEVCVKPTVGVYRLKANIWVCGSCKQDFSTNKPSLRTLASVVGTVEILGYTAKLIKQRSLTRIRILR